MELNATPLLAGLGMSVLDLIQVVEEFPRQSGVTPILSSTMMGGGPVPTALCAASRLGARTVILDRTGDDWRGERIREDYLKHGVDVSFLEKEKGKRSTSGTVLVRRRDGERHLLFDEGDFTPLSEEEISGEVLDQCEILHLNGRHWPACLSAAQRVRKRGGLVSFDGGAHRYDTRYDSLFLHVDILIVAADFADRAVGSGDRFEQIEKFSRFGPATVGITDGICGSWFRFPEGGHFHQAAFVSPRLVDTTGCGDVFHGAFLAGVLRGDSLEGCARFASASAALSACGLGGRACLPTREEVSDFLASGPAVVSVS